MHIHLIAFLKQHFYPNPRDLGFGDATFYEACMNHLANKVYEQLSRFRDDPPDMVLTQGDYDFLAECTVMWLACPISLVDSSDFSNALLEWLEEEKELVHHMIMAYHLDGGPEHHFITPEMQSVPEVNPTGATC